VAPRAVAVDAAGLDDAVAKIVMEESAEVGEGRTVVLAPLARVDALRERIVGPSDGSSGSEVDLEAPVVVLPISSAKGLEFDAVVLVEPAEVLAESPRGANDLYVALTRSTQRLAVVHAGALPDLLHRLNE
jgi:superfamily I DNA/RNA helicase